VTWQGLGRGLGLYVPLGLGRSGAVASEPERFASFTASCPSFASFKSVSDRRKAFTDGGCR